MYGTYKIGILIRYNQLYICMCQELQQQQQSTHTFIRTRQNRRYSPVQLPEF